MSGRRMCARELVCGICVSVNVNTTDAKLCVEMTGTARNATARILLKNKNTVNELEASLKHDRTWKSRTLMQK
jgi:hypothetical protein